MAYQVQFSPAALQHLQGFSARERATLLDRVSRQLTDQPTVETRNRKRMRPNPLAPWELRVADMRVYYDVTEAVAGSEPTVDILAMGRKVRDRVLVAGEEVDV